MDLQEIIARGRFVFSRAPERLAAFNLVNGKRTASDISKSLKRHVNNIHRDLKMLNDAGLIQPKTGRDGQQVSTMGFAVYEKVPLARAVPTSYFTGPSKIHKQRVQFNPATARSKKRAQPLRVPGEGDILDICKGGEDQIYEFKASGTDVRKVTREVAAMLNTREGGLILYGVDDAGTIQGTDVSRQTLDQPLQNSIKNSISPAAIVRLHSVTVLGSEVLVVVVPPWNRKDVYQFDEKVLLRKGTNVFAAKPEELRRLHKGEYII